MKKNRIFEAYYFITLAIVIVNSIFFVKDSFFFSMNDLPSGSLQYSVSSPNNKFSVSVYKVENNLGTAVRVEAVKTDRKKYKARNIFWQTDITDVTLQWIDGDVIVINEVPINIADGGYYDCRRGMSIMTEGSISPEAKKG